MKDLIQIGHLTKFDAFDAFRMTLKLAPGPCAIPEWLMYNIFKTVILYF